MVWTRSISQAVEGLLGVRSVKVVAGDSDADSAAKSLLGMAAAKEFVSGLGDGEQSL